MALLGALTSACGGPDPSEKLAEEFCTALDEADTTEDKIQRLTELRDR